MLPMPLGLARDLSSQHTMLRTCLQGFHSIFLTTTSCRTAEARDKKEGGDSFLMSRPPWSRLNIAGTASATHRLQHFIHLWSPIFIFFYAVWYRPQVLKRTSNEPLRMPVYHALCFLLHSLLPPVSSFSMPFRGSQSCKACKYFTGEYSNWDSLRETRRRAISEAMPH